jgi:stage III sporulation protein AG
VESRPAEGLQAAEESVEVKLESILGQIEGAGEVEVRVTLARGPVYDYAVNTNTNERRVEEGGQGESRRVTTERVAEEELVMRQSAGSQEPVVVQESRPAVQGVLILAEGAEDPLVRARISQAVQTLLGVAPHQVAVLPKVRTAGGEIR